MQPILGTPLHTTPPPHDKKFATKECNFLSLENQELHIDVLRCPQQSNSADYGVYTVLFTVVLVKWFLQGSFQASSFAMPELQESVILTKCALLSHTKICFWSLIKKTISSMVIIENKSDHLGRRICLC